MSTEQMSPIIVPGEGDVSLGGMKRIPSLPVPKQKPWYANWDWWKRASVWISIALSAASLILGSIGEFSTVDTTTQRGLNVSGLVVNSISVALSAITSLNWKSVDQIEADLLKNLDKLLVQQSVLAVDNGASRPGTPSSKPLKPTTRTVHVLKLNHPDDDEGSPLLSSSAANKKKGGKKRKGFRRNSGGNSTSVGNGVV